jgi:16S rRNA C967 or C1407 C5-methylase (RsmB/RsmF family)
MEAPANNYPLSIINFPLQALDLCAAPGGKSTAMRTVLPEGSILVSNEPIPTRAQILLENITKWGWPDCIVTNNYPRDFRKAKAQFDIILCDVPCSGEGMFRKDPATISEWSLQNVEKCWRLQREIVADAWECLNPGGILIYSTCTYNIKENEENVR